MHAYRSSGHQPKEDDELRARLGLQISEHQSTNRTLWIGVAAIGTFAGWKVVRYTHTNPDNRVDRWLLGATIAPSPAGRTVRLWLAPAF